MQAGEVSYLVHGKTPKHLGFCSVLNRNISESSVTSLARCFLPRHCHSLLDRGEIAHLSVTWVLICRMRTVVPMVHFASSHSAAEISASEGAEHHFEMGERQKSTKEGQSEGMSGVRPRAK